MFPISAANSSPPLPSNTGVALAELNKKKKVHSKVFVAVDFILKMNQKLCCIDSSTKVGLYYIPFLNLPINKKL